METFAQRLRRLRTEQGLTMVDLAAAARCTEGTIRHLEGAVTTSPGLPLGVRLADALHVDVRYLTTGDGESLQEQHDALERRVTKIEKQLVQYHGRRR